MEFYNTHQIQQLAPLVTFSLDDSETAAHLKTHLLKSNIANCVWDNSILKNRLLSAKYLLDFSTEAAARARIERKPKKEGTHSAQSPFNADSDLFPNGILSENWFYKYTQNVPFALVQSYTLGEATEDEALGTELANQRLRYADWGVKFVAILLSDGDPIVDQDRVDKLRLLSGLPRLTGIFYLNSSKDTLERDCGILASSLFNNLKAPAADFYSSVEARIKQRYKKYYTMPPVDAVDTKVSLTPKFLEVRNMIKQAMMLQLIHPHNVESSFAMLESSYERLIDLTADHISVFFDEAVSEHDSRLYAQFRQLLDIIAIHLIRGYLSTEEPTAALRKHEAHIANVLLLCNDQLEADNAAWVSVQYQWLAELMQMVPPSVLTDLDLSHQVKQKAYQNSVAYFGGSTFHDTFNSTITTQAYLLFLKSYKKLEDAKPAKIRLSYLKKLESGHELQLRRLLLLEKAQESLQSQLQQNTQLDGLLSYLDWLKAEELFHNEQFEEAERSYRKILDNTLPKSWRIVSHLLRQRLTQIYEKLNDHDKLLETFTELASHKRPILAPPLEKFDLDRSAELSFSGKENFFDVQVNLFNGNLKKEFFAFDTIISQISWQPIFDTNRLQDLINGSEALLHVDKIGVNYEGRSIIIKNDGVSCELSQVKLDALAEYSANFSNKDNYNTFQILEEVTKPGKYKIESVGVYSTLLVKANGHTITLKKSEIHSLLEKKPKQWFAALLKDGDDVKQHMVRTQGQDAFECTVQPYKPEINVDLSLPFNSIIMGEKVEIPVSIAHHKAPHYNDDFSSLGVQLRSRLLEGDQELESLVPQTNWQDLKDDEDLSILELFGAGDGQLESSLQVSIRKPPSMQPKLDIKLVIEMQLIVGESNKSLSVYELKTFEVPVLWKPFLTRLEVSPRYREDSSLDMKNPFILSDKAGDTEKNLSMPSPSRVWAAEARIARTNDTDELSKQDSILVKHCQFSLRSKNPEVEIQKIGDIHNSSDYALQLFVSNSRHRFSHRLIGVIVSAVFTWTRGENGPENEFETEEWEVNLPLQDPRVLLHSAKTEDGKTVLEYVIENPTSRIFTFTTNLALEDSALRGVDWKFEDKSNIVPLKQGAFPVLPFSRHEMVFSGSYEAEDGIELVELPQLSVYDLNYKVSLPTLPVSENAVVQNERLYMKT